MKIGLISPKGGFWLRPEDFDEICRGNEQALKYQFYYRGLSAALPVIAGLTPKGHEITIIDENIESIDLSAPYDIVGITSITQQATRAYQIADAFRTRGVPVVIGGIHATMLPEEAKLHADSVVIGEAELTWGDLLADAAAKRLKPFYRSDERADLSQAPLPRYDLIAGKGYEVYWVQTTRGCPHDCEFCAASKVFGSQYRCKTASQVIAEIDHLRQHAGKFRLCFADDNFFIRRDVYEPLMDYLKAAKISWIAQTDVSLAEKDAVLATLADSGCVFVLIGFESLNESVLTGLDARDWKRGKSARYGEYVRKIQSSGVGVHASFIFGIDGDDESSFDRVIDFVKENSVFAVQAAALMPLPGTRTREKLMAEQRVLDTPWENYTTFGVNYIPRAMTPETLRTGLLKVYQTAASPEHFWNTMRYFKGVARERIRRTKEQV